MMKLSNDTLSILKNFASISTGLYVPGGKKVRVKEAQNKILAEANFNENFPSFCVSDLQKFLGILTMDKDVDIEFKGSDIVLSMMEGKSKINYRCSPKNLVNVPKDNDITIEDEFVKFKLTKDDLNYVQKVSSVLGLPCIAFEWEKKSGLVVRVFDPTNDGENQQTLKIELKDKPEGDFQVIFSKDSLKFLEGDYEVKINKMAAQFKHGTYDLKYWVAPEVGSNFPS